MIGGEKERLVALKTRIQDLEVQLQDKSDRLDQFEALGNAADQKMSDQNSIHGDKVRSLMNSIQMLKKENAKHKDQNKNHKRSKLIEDLNKEIQDQDAVSQVLRELVNDETKCDNAIMAVFRRGPPTIRAPSREELKVENKKLNAQLLALKQNKPKAGGEALNDSQISKASTVSSQKSTNNQPMDTNDTLIMRIKELKNENEDLLLNLKAEEEIRARYEDEIQRRAHEFNDLKGAKTDLIILTKKYEVLQRQLQEINSAQTGQEIHHLNKDLQIEEMQIMSKAQGGQQEVNEQIQKIEIEAMAVKIEQSEQNAEDNKQEYTKVLLKYDDLTKRFNELQSKFLGIRELNNKIKIDMESKTKDYESQIEILVSKKSQQEQESLLIQANLQIEALTTDNNELTQGLMDLEKKLACIKLPDSDEQGMDQQIKEMLKKHEKEGQDNLKDATELTKKLKMQREYYETTIKDMQRKLVVADQNHAKDIDNVSSDVSRLLEKHDLQQNIDDISSNVSQSVRSMDTLYAGHHGLIQNQKLNKMSSDVGSILNTEEQKVDHNEYEHFDSQVSYPSSLLEEEHELLQAPKITKKQQYKQIQHISQMDSSVGSMISQSQRNKDQDEINSNISHMSLKSQKSSFVNKSQLSKMSSNVSSMRGQDLNDISSDLSQHPQLRIKNKK